MGRETRTQTTADPPQLMLQGAPGYQAANTFYQGQLNQPDVYGGQRFAGANEMQNQGFMGGFNTLTGGPQGPAYRRQAENEMGTTLGGGWMGGQEMQNAVAGAATPIFERFENQTMPGIRDRAQFSGGAEGSRRTVANTNAIQELGQSIGSGVVAPIYQGERERMTRQSIEGSQGLLGQDVARSGALYDLGERRRQLEELPVNAQRDQFEEWLARRGTAADSLIAAATTGPGGSLNRYTPSDWRIAMGSGKA